MQIFLATFSLSVIVHPSQHKTEQQMEPKEYFEGREAFKRGIVDCPYLDRQQYLDWNRGWWDEANECAKESR